MSRQKIDLGLTGYDELFMNDQERKENRLPKIYDIPLTEIDDFPNHPFKVKEDEDMESINRLLLFFEKQIYIGGNQKMNDVLLSN